MTEPDEAITFADELYQKFVEGGHVGHAAPVILALVQFLATDMEHKNDALDFVDFVRDLLECGRISIQNSDWEKLRTE